MHDSRASAECRHHLYSGQVARSYLLQQICRVHKGDTAGFSIQKALDEGWPSEAWASLGFSYDGWT